jgi:hypothetical protein
MPYALIFPCEDKEFYCGIPGAVKHVVARFRAGRSDALLKVFLLGMPPIATMLKARGRAAWQRCWFPNGYSYLLPVYSSPVLGLDPPLAGNILPTSVK